MITRHQLLGIHLLAGCVMTLFWIFLCPRYTPGGPGQYWTQKRHTDGNLLRTEYWRLDFGMFVGGEIIIWTGVFGVYFLRKPGAEPGAAPNGGPATQLGGSGVTEGPPSVS